MESFEFDAYAPAQMAARVEKAGIIKGSLDFISTFTLAVLAGSFTVIGSVMVGQPGKAIGIVSEADIVRKVISANHSPASVKAEQIMSTPLVSVDVKTPVYDINRTMADNRIRHLVITEQGQWVGFISVKDLLRRPII